MKQLVETFKALGDLTRLKILKLITLREVCVCELASVLCVTQPCISQHLRRLKTAGLANERREGQWVYYSANRDALASLGASFGSFLEASLDSLPEMKHVAARIRELGNLDLCKVLEQSESGLSSVS